MTILDFEQNERSSAFCVWNLYRSGKRTYKITQILVLSRKYLRYKDNIIQYGLQYANRIEVKNLYFFHTG